MMLTEHRMWYLESSNYAAVEAWSVSRSNFVRLLLDLLLLEEEASKLWPCVH